MRLGAEKLDEALARGLAPVYLIAGDEPLQFGEAAALVRERARAAGFTERELLEPGRDFDWSQLAGAVGSLSLFADRRLVELRLGGPGDGGGDEDGEGGGDKLGRVGADAIRGQCERPGRDVLLLILAPNLDRKGLQGKWVEAVDRVGVVVQVRAPKGGQLTPWLTNRLRRAGFAPTPEAVALLAERVEGNLLAAAQEITKLRLLREPGPLDADGLLGAVADSARYGLFDLSDAALAGDLARVDRVLAVLRGEGTAEPLVLWVLAREVRKLAAVAFAQVNRRDLAPVFNAHQVWDSQRPAVLAAVRRLGLRRLWELVEQCAAADQAIKGRGPGDPWALLGGIAEGLGG